MEADAKAAAKKSRNASKVCKNHEMGFLKRGNLHQKRGVVYQNNDEIRVKNEELCIKNEEICIKTDELCSQSERRPMRSV